MTGFNVQVFSNEYLPPGGTDVHAVVTVIADSTVAGAGAAAAPSEAVEVLVLDTSGSMQHDGRIREARRALAAAINQIRDGVWFSVVAGTEVARLAFPAPHLAGVHNGAVRANDQTRSPGARSGQVPRGQRRYRHVDLARRRRRHRLGVPWRHPPRAAGDRRQERIRARGCARRRPRPLPGLFPVRHPRRGRELERRRAPPDLPGVSGNRRHHPPARSRWPRSSPPS